MCHVFLHIYYLEVPDVSLPLIGAVNSDQLMGKYFNVMQVVSSIAVFSPQVRIH